MDEIDDATEMFEAIFSLMDKGLVVAFWDEGTIRYVPVVKALPEQIERRVTKEQILEHYARGGE